MSEIELSIVMPCLNESKTVGACVDEAIASMSVLGLTGEVVIADNNSTDDSAGIAQDHGARVVHVAEKGYGAALQGGIAAARGKFVIMGDADESYDFSSIGPMVEALRAGNDLVMGNRFKGGIQAGAMPALHKYLGNPVLSFVGRLFFKIEIGDFHCGLRGFDRQRILDLGLTCSGMEFASEMVVKASLADYRVSEVPTVLRPDGRDRQPHLRSFRDGWRHLRFLLLFSPTWLFLYPGIVVFVLGVVAMIRLWIGPLQIGGVTFDIHTLLYTAGMAIMGVQMIYFAILTQTIGAGIGRLRPQSRLNRVIEAFSLERGLLTGIVAMLLGLLWTATAVWQWGQVSFAELDPITTMRDTIPAVALMVIGLQTLISSFFLSAIQLFQDRAD